MRFRWLMLLGAVLAALALLGTACGGGDEDEAGDDGGAATATLDSGDGDGAGEETPEATGEDDGDDDGAHDSSAGAVDACSLITKDEAEAALGTSVGEGQKGDYPPVYGCEYASEDFSYVAVTVVVFNNDDEARAVHDMAIESNAYEEVDDIGDSAYFALGFGITALQDEYEVSVDVIGPDDDQDLEEELAKKAVERLP